MKRKLWIALALMAVLAAFCFGAAHAETYTLSSMSFSFRPYDVYLYPDAVPEVTWEGTAPSGESPLASMAARPYQDPECQQPFNLPELEVGESFYTFFSWFIDATTDTIDFSKLNVNNVHVNGNTEFTAEVLRTAYDSKFFTVYCKVTKAAQTYRLSSLSFSFHPYNVYLVEDDVPEMTWEGAAPSAESPLTAMLALPCQDPECQQTFNHGSPDDFYFPALDVGQYFYTKFGYYSDETTCPIDFFRLSYIDVHVNGNQDYSAEVLSVSSEYKGQKQYLYVTCKITRLTPQPPTYTLRSIRFRLNPFLHELIIPSDPEFVWEGDAPDEQHMAGNVPYLIIGSYAFYDPECDIPGSVYTTNPDDPRDADYYYIPVLEPGEFYYTTFWLSSIYYNDWKLDFSKLTEETITVYMDETHFVELLEFSINDGGESLFGTCKVTTLPSQAQQNCEIQFLPGELGSGTMSKLSAQNGAQVTIPACGFTAPAGYAFYRWKDAFASPAVYYYSGDQVTLTEHKTLVAEWQERTCVVRFDPNGGSGSMPAKQVHYNGKLTLPACGFTNGIHHFRNWRIGDIAYQPGDEVTVTQNMTVYADWTYRCAVVFNHCGHGSAQPTQYVEVGTCAKQPEAMSQAGLIFGGWYTDRDYTTKYDFTTPVTEDITLYAWWGHTVTYDMNGRNEIYNMTHSVREGQKAPAYTRYMNTDFNGWFLTGWYTEPACVNAFSFDSVITKDITLYAKWEYDGFTVTYDWNGTHNVTSCKLEGHSHFEIYEDEPVNWSVRTGECFTRLIPLRFTGAGDWISFTGWYTEPACENLYDFTLPATANITLYAGWGQNHTLILHKNNPYGTYSSPFDCTIPYDEVPGDSEWLTYHLQNPGNYTGYVHAGWYTDEACTVPFDPSEPLTGTVHVYSKWALAEYTVIFDVNGGTGMNNVTLTLHHGDAITAPAIQPTLTNYVFRGWTGSDGTHFYVWSPTTEIACTGDVTYSAYWIPDGIAINSSNFPDAAFRDFVAQYDTNEDGYLWVSECDAVTNISIYNHGVTSLRGIENFTELKTLVCNGNALTSLYLARNEKLTTLRCNDNQLTSLDLSGNTVLTQLFAQNNCLTSLNTVNCRALTSVYIQNNPNLTDAVFAAPNLRTLQIQNTGITTLDLSACPGLAYAATNGSVYHYTTSGYSTYSADYENWYYQLSVTLYASVDGFITSGIPIDEAHFPDEGFRRLVGDRYHDLNGNGTLSQSEIDQAYSLNGGYSGTYSLEGIQYLPNISYIVLKNVGLEQIDLSGNPLVNTLVVSGNHLNAVDVSMLAELTHLDVAKNPGLVTLTLGSAPLETLNCYQCPYIRSLDLSSQPHLLKAYMESDGYYSDDEYGQYMTYSWVNEGETVIGSLRVDADIDIALPEWRWNSLEDVRFVMPDGSETAADVTRTVSPDGKTVTYTSAVVLDQVPFEDSKTYHLVTFAGADVPAQELEAGEAVAWPGIPFMAGSIFEGWYADADCTEEYIFGTAVSEGFTVYAKWTTPAPASFLKLPAALSAVESEAFSGVAAQAVIVLENTVHIAYDAFSGSDVEYIYGYAGTAAEAFADAYDFTFVPIDDNWTAGH